MTAHSILIVGHSHIFALGVPLQHDAYEIVPVGDGGKPVFGLVGEWPREDSRYWEETIAHAPGRVVAIIWRGNQHFQHFLISPNDSFDFLLDSEPDLPLEPDCQIVPEAAVRQFMHDDMSDLDPILEGIKAAGGVPVLCGTPPPKGDAAFVRQKIMREDYFQGVAEDFNVDIASVRLSSPLFLFKLWAVMQQSLQAVAERHGGRFVAVPKRAQTEEGFLHPQCYADDATHANSLYGQWMLDALYTAIADCLEVQDGA